MNDYYQNSAISQSAIKVFLSSKEEYHHVCVQKNRPESKASFFEFGKLYHTLFLEPHKFATDYVVAPQKPSVIPSGFMKVFIEELAATEDYDKAYLKSGYTKYTKEKVIANYLEDPNLLVYKEYFTQILEMIGRKIVSYDDYQKASTMINKLKSYKVVKDIMDDINTPFSDVTVLLEHELFFNIERVDQISLKAKPDLIIINHTLKTVIIYDLKSTKAKILNDFIYSIKAFGYGIQASFYLYACKQCLTDYSDYSFEFKFIPQSTEEPHRFLGLLQLDEASISHCEQLWTKALFEMNECYRTNNWSDIDYNDTITISILDE